MEFCNSFQNCMDRTKYYAKTMILRPDSPLRIDPDIDDGATVAIEVVPIFTRETATHLAQWIDRLAVPGTPYVDC